MKRDMDLIRRIILAVDDLPIDKPLTELSDVEARAFAMHAQWLSEAGLVHASFSPRTGNAPATFAAIFRLTWAGCEFADAIRSDTLWNKAKDKVIKPGMSFTFEVLTTWLKAEIQHGLPSLVG